MQTKSTNKKSPNELKHEFNNQFKLLEKFCCEFDNGNESAALFIGGLLRNLLYDSESIPKFDANLTKSSSEFRNLILEQSNLKDKITFKLFLRKYDSIHSRIINEQKTKIASKSLLSILNAKNIKIYETRMKDKNAIANYHISSPHANDILQDIMKKSNSGKLPYEGLCAKQIYIDKGVTKLKYVPLFMHTNIQPIDKSPKISFNEWWNAEIFDNKVNYKLSRKQLILNSTNLDGYAHIDEKIDQQFETFKRADFISFQNDKMKFFGTYTNIPVNTSIRQIAYEFMESARIELKDLLYDRDWIIRDGTPISKRLLFDMKWNNQDEMVYFFQTITKSNAFLQKISYTPRDQNIPEKAIVIYSMSIKELETVRLALIEAKIPMENIRIETM